MKQCNICGGTEFGTGPNGRSGKNGSMPYCRRCGSLERHRELRIVLDELLPWSLNQNILQISPEPTCAYGGQKHFAKHEISVFGGENSIDLQKIERDDNAYDMVMCNHVLEHVKDDAKALAELLRVGQVVELMLPGYADLKHTKDWGFPDSENHGHYRVYGKDIWQRFSSIFCVMELPVADPVTKADDIVLFLSKVRINLEPLADKLAKKFHTKIYWVNLAS